jgi:hypothetical protein
MFGLTTEDLNHPRNYLRLAKPIKVALDNKSITVIEQNRQLVLFVLDDALKQRNVSNTRYTFNDCHLWPLKFQNSSRPFIRILAAHCRNSFIDAFRLRQINYETYKLGYNSSVTMLNASPDGSKAKVFHWFERNKKMIDKEEKKKKRTNKILSIRSYGLIQLLILNVINCFFISDISVEYKTPDQLFSSLLFLKKFW